jgi:hypothetical protein
MTSTKDVGKYSCKTGYKDETQTDQAAGQWSFMTFDQRRIAIGQWENNAAIKENVSLVFSCPMRI